MAYERPNMGKLNNCQRQRGKTNQSAHVNVVFSGIPQRFFPNKISGKFYVDQYNTPPGANSYQLLFVIAFRTRYKPKMFYYRGLHLLAFNLNIGLYSFLRQINKFSSCSCQKIKLKVKNSNEPIRNKKTPLIALN